IREVRIQNQDVRFSRANQGEQVRAVAGEADYLDIGLLLEPAAGSLAKHRKLVDDDNPGGAVFLDHGMHSLQCEYRSDIIRPTGGLSSIFWRIGNVRRKVSAVREGSDAALSLPEHPKRHLRHLAAAD